MVQVWDREIILTAAKDYYAKDVNLLEKDIEGNFTDVRALLILFRLKLSYIIIILFVRLMGLTNIPQGIWSDDLASWRECGDLFSCVNK